MSNATNEEILMNKREAWLEEHSANSWDVMEDDDGREYIMTTEENGTAGEDGYSVDDRRVYLPEFKLED